MLKRILTTMAVSAASVLATAGASKLLDRKNQHLLPMYRTLEQKLLLDGSTTGFFIIHSGPGISTLYFRKDKFNPMKEVPPGECQAIIEFLGEYLMQCQAAGTPEQIQKFKEHMENVAQATGLGQDNSDSNNGTETPSSTKLPAGYL